MPFKKGESGNPAGRPKGSGWVHKLRQAIRDELPDILAVVAEQARNGDTAAAKLLLDRGIPALRPGDAPLQFELPDGQPSDQGRAVVRAMAQGDLTPDQAERLLSALAEQARLTEFTELERRIAALEEAHAQHP